MKKGYIYALICPIINDIRYVGQTSRTLEFRLSRHISKTKSKVYKNQKLTHKENWLKKLIDNDIIHLLKIKQLEECNVDILNEREEFWISKYKLKDKKLTNLTNGGNQYCNNNYTPTEETKRKISLGMKKSKIFKNAMQNKERREKISKANKGKKLTEEHKMKISKSNKKGQHAGNKNSFYGKTHTEETKEKLSEYAKKRTKDKNSFYGKTHSEITKEKIRNTLKNKPKKIYYVYNSENKYVDSGTSAYLKDIFKTNSVNEISRFCDKEKKYKGFFIMSKPL